VDKTKFTAERIISDVAHTEGLGAKRLDLPPSWGQYQTTGFHPGPLNGLVLGCSRLGMSCRSIRVKTRGDCLYRVNLIIRQVQRRVGIRDNPISHLKCHATKARN
jgi:hypothetical protein